MFTTTLVTSSLNDFATRSAVSCTSLWFNSTFEIPAAIFVIQEIPQISIPIWRAAIASHAVLIPTASPPQLCASLISAGVS